MGRPNSLTTKRKKKCQGHRQLHHIHMQTVSLSISYAFPHSHTLLEQTLKPSVVSTGELLLMIIKNRDSCCGTVPPETSPRTILDSEILNYEGEGWGQRTGKGDQMDQLKLFFACCCWCMRAKRAAKREVEDSGNNEEYGQAGDLGQRG